MLEAAVAGAAGRRARSRVFWDVDAPATLDRVARDPDDPFRALIPRYDLVLTYGGGPPVVGAYEALGARAACRSTTRSTRQPIIPVAPDPRFEADLGLPRQSPAGPRGARRGVLPPSRAAPCRSDGSCWAAAAGTTRRMPANVDARSATSTRATTTPSTCTPQAVLNISRESMARYGFSPATRVFEAAGAGACLITDAWEGIELFLEPGAKCWSPRDGDEVAEHLRTLDPRARRGDRRAARCSACWPSTPTPHAPSRVEGAASMHAMPEREAMRMSRE